MESHLQERLCERVAGRVLLRHANLTEFQREMMALKEQGQMRTFDQVIALLRPLDRPELLAQAAGAELGVQAAKHYPVLKLDGEQGQEGEEEESQQEYSDDEVMELADGEYLFEDKEYTEDEAVYIQAYHSAYADVRRDLQNRRKERGYATSCRVPSDRILAIYAGVQVSSTQALVDTAAEDAVIGERAMARFDKELQRHGLRSVVVPSTEAVPCAGIGGQATIKRIVDAPAGVAGTHFLLGGDPLDHRLVHRGAADPGRPLFVYDTVAFRPSRCEHRGIWRASLGSSC